MFSFILILALIFGFKVTLLSILWYAVDEVIK